MGEPVVRVKKVSKRYSTDVDAAAVLDEVDLEVAEGEFIGVMGRSGSGKTTLLNLVGGLDRDFKGSVEVLGRDLASLGDRELSRLRNEAIGFIFQAYHLLPHMSSAENVALPASFSPELIAKLDERVTLVLEKVGLADRRDDLPTNLSGGQKQRVAIARSLLMSPRLLLCDEPTGNLDERTGRELIEAMKELSKAEGLTVIIVTHEEHLTEYCDRVIRLHDGRVLPADEGEA